MSHYWTFTIIAIIFVGTIAFMGGYRLGFISQDTGQIVVNPEEQPDIAGDILDQQIIDGLYTPETSDDIRTIPAEVYAFTGYVRSITPTEIVVEHSSSKTEWPDALTFTLQESTIITETFVINQEQGPSTYEENDLTRQDISTDDIVTVYTEEDIKTSEARTVTKIKRIPQTETNTENLFNLPASINNL